MRKVIPVERLAKRQLAVDAFLYPEHDYWRPTTRADCTNVPRPCPYVSCRYNTYLDVKHNGNIAINYECEPWDVPSEQSCVLDMAEIYEDGLTLREVSDVIGISRERVRQIEGDAAESVKTAVDPSL